MRRLEMWLAWASTAAILLPLVYAQSKPSDATAALFPEEETLSYSVEWRLIYAGSARLALSHEDASRSAAWSSRLHLESGGMVSKFLKLNDNYSAEFGNGFCTMSTDLEGQEGRKRYSTKVTYDQDRGKAIYLERDLVKNATKSSEIDIPACASDMIGSLYKLRTLRLDPGQSMQMPVSDGKKAAMARVEAQDREQITTKAGTFKTIRYESYVFNGVVYARKARLLVWISDDARRLPVQFQFRLAFPVGSITLQLDKEEHSPIATAMAER